MNVRAILTTATFLIVAVAPAQAQTAKDNEGLRDILNRAQSQSDRKAVEDLIGKLGGASQARPPAPAAPPTSASAPAAPAPATPSTSASAPATPAQAPAAPSAPATAATPPASSPSATAPATASAPDAPQPGPASPPQADLPASAPATAASTPAPDSPPATPSFGAAASGTASPGPPASTAARRPRRPTPPTATDTAPSAPQDAPSTASAPPEPLPATSEPSPTAAAAPATPPATPRAGTPIGPAEALPTPIGPSDAEMARAPQIAREQGLPNVDIEVLFGYDSSDIAPETAESLMNLGRALSDPRLAGQRFVIAGHTDARGTRAYNGALSDRRAQSVRQFLIEHFKLAPDQLVARGFGETQLKIPRNPRAPENRRVQVINWTGQTAVRNGR